MSYQYKRRLKCISLWEPWATLIAMGVKTVETRSWYSDYEGELLICAAKTTKGMKLADNWPAGSLPPGFKPNYGKAVALVEKTEGQDVSFHIIEILPRSASHERAGVVPIIVKRIV